MQRDLNIYLPAMEKQLNILDTLYEVHGLESDEVVWLQQDGVFKLQGLCLLTKIYFVLDFLDIISVHCIFSGGKSVVSVLGEGYVWFVFFHWCLFCV